MPERAEGSVVTESALLPQNRPMGRPPLENPWVPFNTKVPPEIRTMLEDYADSHGVPMVDVLCRAVEAYTSRSRRVVQPWPRIPVRRPKG